MKQRKQEPSDESLIEKLSNSHEILIIEQLLHDKLKQYNRLGFKADKLDFQRIVDEGDLDGRLAEVKKDVDDFLHINHIPSCGIRYNLIDNAPCYHHPTSCNVGQISLIKEPRAILITTIAHEYTHHIQHFFSMRSRALQEGMARGIEGHIAEIYSKKEGNEAFLYMPSKYTIEELAQCYVALCNTIGLPYNRMLTKKVNTLTGEECETALNYYGAGCYALGVTCFCIEEAKNGKGVYRDALRSLMTE